MPHPLGDYDTFVVRVYSRQRVLVHGEVVHVGTKRQLRFSSPKALVTFIIDQLGTSRQLRDDDDQNRNAND